MTKQTLDELLTRIERLSAEKQRLADSNAALRADRELLKTWNARTAARGSKTRIIVTNQAVQLWTAFFYEGRHHAYHQAKILRLNH
jgi:hypothetical protein